MAEVPPSLNQLLGGRRQASSSRVPPWRNARGAASGRPPSGAARISASSGAQRAGSVRQPNPRPERGRGCPDDEEAQPTLAVVAQASPTMRAWGTPTCKDRQGSTPSSTTRPQRSRPTCVSASRTRSSQVADRQHDGRGSPPAPPRRAVAVLPDHPNGLLARSAHSPGRVNRLARLDRLVCPGCAAPPCLRERVALLRPTARIAVPSSRRPPLCRSLGRQRGPIAGRFPAAPPCT